MVSYFRTNILVIAPLYLVLIVFCLWREINEIPFSIPFSLISEASSYLSESSDQGDSYSDPKERSSYY